MIRWLLSRLLRDARGQASVEWLLVAVAVFILCATVDIYVGRILFFIFHRTAVIISLPTG